MKLLKTCTGNNRKGFTLIEILIVIAIIAMLMALGLFLSFDSYRRYNLNAECDIVVGVLERARSRALNNMFESPHGVHFSTSTYTIFIGNFYDSSTSTNETIPANRAVLWTPTSTTDIFFEQLTASTTGGAITLKEGAQSRDITINHEGTIIW